MKKQTLAIGLLPLVFLLCLPGCSDGNGKPDAGQDAGDLDADGSGSDAGMDAQDAGDPGPGDGGDQAPDDRPRALLLDQALRHRSSWIELIDALEANGYRVEYRRYFPHLTAADATPGEQGLPYPLVIMAAGDVPAIPSSVMRPGDIENLENLVNAGGVLLLAPHSGCRGDYSDYNTGDNDWFLMNRLLESLAVGVRIDKNTIFGAAWIPDQGQPEPPYQDSDWGYASTLDFQIGYPYFLATAHPACQGITKVAGGKAPALRVAGQDVAVLLRTYPNGFTSGTCGWINYLTTELPMAALAPAGEGYVAVVGRSLLSSLGATSGGITDKPAHDHQTIDSNRNFLDQLVAHLGALGRGEIQFEPLPPEADDQMFSVSAPGYEPLGPNPVVAVTIQISDRPVHQQPPGGELDEDPPAAPADPPATPAWMSPGGARIGYGDNLGPDGMITCFEEVVTHGLDALLTNSQPELMIDPYADPADTQYWNDMHVGHAALASAAGARWIASGYFAGSIHSQHAGEYPNMVGAQGQMPQGPAPVDPKLWNDFMIPTYQRVGEVARDDPGLFGLSFDMELYQGPLYHSDGYAFSDSSAQTATADFPTGLADAVRGLAPEDRLEYLVDIGRLKGYLSALEAAAADLGRQCREAAHQNAPDLQLFVYNLIYPDSWFLRGFLRGLGTPDKPVVALSYAAWGKRATEALQQDGIAVLHLGGTLVGRFTPADFQASLVSLASGNHGYWFLSMKDFSASNPDPTAIHGQKSEYWEAVEAANQILNP